MAKMFYSMDEAASKLGMSQSDIQGLVSSGQLQEFRDGDRLMFKVDQVDLLAGGDDGDDMISLNDSADMDALSASSSGSLGIGLDDSNSPVSTAGGISIFDADTEADADPSAATQITDRPGAAMDFSFDSAASGSGLSNLALETDDTSLGQDVLADVYGDGSGEGSGVGSGMGSGMGSAADSEFGVPAAVGGGDLFETSPSQAAAPVGAGMAMGSMAEAYDGSWSGIAGGLALGVALAMLAGLVFVVAGLAGASPEMLIGEVTQTTVYIVVGAVAGVMLIGAVLGFVMLRKS